ncbi:cob(I)yrinic acid a,c-diamide adenosyltransferase [Olivibacter sitiensis]|uniref:cob(I)yrinic acid a,c-diamide adenosyltransferase n=1 Tax=Olivibacter sitiensis TaxID=376470 RepID=UPI0004224800|nr:cob(I)yrinic acid a,c-diamide adenosyltransferase [Olivibacter sitiensis]
MKIYTKTGDDGTTSLIGGTRVSKSHTRIESYGTLDELNSYIGFLRSYKPDAHIDGTLIQIQQILFDIGALLAFDASRSKLQLYQIQDADILALEQAIDEMDSHLAPLKSFILPGGSATISVCHIARCICRRAERLVVHLSEDEPVHPEIIQYLNRLSDYLFVLARKMAQDSGVEETLWIPRKP